MSLALRLVLALAPATPSAAPADAPRADNIHYRAAQAAFTDGRWQDALAALERAYGVDPRPEYLFMQAQVLRTHDRCPEAIERYREFIAAAPPREDVLSAQAGLTLCGAAEPAATPRVAPRPTEAPPPAPILERSRRSAADPLAHALIWPGLAVAGAGAGLLGGAYARVARARNAASEPEFARTARAGPAMSQAGIALLSIGGAVLIAGIVRQIVVSRRTKKSRARVVVLPVLLWQ